MSDRRFAFVDSVSNNKRDLIRSGEYREQEYDPFIVNRALSYFPDTVLYAAEMNVGGHLDKIMQYDYYRHSLRPNRRFAKWHKFDKEVVEAVQQAFTCSRLKAIEVIKTLPPETLQETLQEYQHGRDT